MMDDLLKTSLLPCFPILPDKGTVPIDANRLTRIGQKGKKKERLAEISVRSSAMSNGGRVSEEVGSITLPGTGRITLSFLRTARGRKATVNPPSPATTPLIVVRYRK